MIEIRNEIVEDIPLLHVVKSDKGTEMLPTVFFIHGFTSAKEHNLHFAYLLAEKGFRVLLPDADLHGERALEEKGDKLVFHFWEIVIKTIQELDTLKKHFADAGLVNQQHIGMVGTSMGGIITLGAMSQYDWISAAVSLMGSPNYVEFAKMQIEQLKQSGVSLPFTEQELDAVYDNLAPFDLSSQPLKLQERPLMFWHGKNDPVVPFAPTYRFYESIKQAYAHHKDNLQFLVDEQAAHKVSREALLETVSWFDKHLA